MRPYSPGGALNALAAALGVKPPTPSAHRLRRGLPGYLILFATHAFEAQCQLRTRKPPSLLVFFLISSISPLHQEFRFPLPHSRVTVSEAGLQLSCNISPLTYHPTYTPFTPSKSGQRLLPPYYRGCWHGVSRSFLWRYRQRRQVGISSLLKSFTHLSASSLTRRCWFRLSPIDQYSSLLPPVGVWPVSQCQCG